MYKRQGLAFIDGKLAGDEIETIYQYCCWAGREQDLLILNPGTPSMSNTYNPILRGDPDEVASRILSIIPSTENNPGADHYKQSANRALYCMYLGENVEVDASGVGTL